MTAGRTGTSAMAGSKATGYGRKKSPVTVRGAWVAMSRDFMRSRACAELSPHGLKLLVDMCSQLGPNARGNGDLSAAPSVLKARGWVSNASLSAAVAELLDCSLLSMTRRGGRRHCALYAITLWPLDCDLSKLDHGPGSYTTLDWELNDKRMSEPPTNDDPAKWRAARKTKSVHPPRVNPPELCTRHGGTQPAKAPENGPSFTRHGCIKPVLSPLGSPATGHLSRTPSGAAVAGPVSLSSKGPKPRAARRSASTAGSATAVADAGEVL